MTGKRRVDALEVGGQEGAAFPGPGAELQVFPDGERGEYGSPLGHLHQSGSDDPIGPSTRDVGAAENHSAGAGSHDAAQREERRTLARSVRAYQRHYLALVYPKADAPHRLDRAVPELESFHFQKGGHHSLPR